MVFSPGESFVLKSYLCSVMQGAYLTRDEAESAMNLMLDGADPYQTAALLSILKYRGEGPNELAGMISSLQKAVVSVHLPFSSLDIVGTGGDLANTVNLSTGTAIVAAACGIPIAKHGNRSVSSQSGSADVLEALEIEINMSREEFISCVQEVGIGFMFAPNYHPSLKKLAPLRRSIKFPTVFNILGPLLNPADTEYALIGVASEAVLDLMSDVCVQSLNKRIFLFHGSGLDELTTLGKVVGYEIHHGKKTYLEIHPNSLGFSSCTMEELRGGDAQKNAQILLKAFSGEKSAVQDALVLGAGAALWIFGKANTLEEGVEVANDVLISGEALEVLQKWKKFSKRVRLKRIG